MTRWTEARLVTGGLSEVNPMITLTEGERLDMGRRRSGERLRGLLRGKHRRGRHRRGFLLLK